MIEDVEVVNSDGANDGLFFEIQNNKDDNTSKIIYVNIDLVDIYTISIDNTNRC